MACAPSPSQSNGKVVTRRVLFRLGCQLLLASVFVYSAFSKWVSGPQGVELSLVTVGMREPLVVFGIARLLPFFEFALGLWLAVARFPARPAVISLAFLGAMTSFLILLGSANGWSSVCNCTGTINAGSVIFGLFRNFALIALSSGIVFMSGRPFSTLRHD